ncbi:MAG: STAS domain-containing protein [Actinomycetota bacterium]|nr:STAS domain-containing protein [Actinomycetota bacterium]
MSETPVYGCGAPREPGSCPADPTVDELLRLESYRCGEAVVVVVAGEIDMVTAARMHETLVAQLSPRPELMVIDLEGVGFLGSMGLTALALTERLAREQGVGLRVVATSRTTLRPLEITGMASDLAVYASREEALAGLFGSGPDALPAPRIP